MENFQDRGVWIRIRFVLRGWIRIRIRFFLRGWIRIRSISDRIRNPADSKSAGIRQKTDGTRQKSAGIWQKSDGPEEFRRTYTHAYCMQLLTYRNIALIDISKDMIKAPHNTNFENSTFKVLFKFMRSNPEYQYTNQFTYSPLLKYEDVY